jgi:hypothetical protein
MALRFSKLGWKAGVVGLALLAGGEYGVKAAPPQEPNQTASTDVVPVSATYVAIVESLIDDAMQDGLISTEERKLILGQARRRLSGTELAQVEARLATLPSPAVTLGTTIADQGQGGTAAPTAAVAAPVAQNGKQCCDEPGCGGWFDNMYYFAAADAWKGMVDDDISNNFGLRAGVNLGAPLPYLECHGIGGQIGLSGAMYDFHGRSAVGGAVENSSIERQLFLTTGVFQRADLCGDCPQPISWGLVFDYMVSDNIGEESDEIHLGQWRGQIGYALDGTNEVGLMASLGDDDDEMESAGVEVHPINQVSVFYHHKWCNLADTRTYVGLAEDPGEFVLGGNGEVPLSSCLSLFGGAHYILPSTGGGAGGSEFAEDTWSVSVGLTYYPGGNAQSNTVAGRKWMPLLPVADNGSFALETPAGGF